MVDAERWVDSPVRGDIYQVSDQGRVRRRFKDGTYRIKAQYLDTNGYLRTGVSSTVPVHIHRLVALAFLEQTGPVVRHLDGNPLNNTVTNLAWGTHTENMRDLLRHGRHRAKNKTHCKNGHPFDATNTYIWVSARGVARVCRTCNRVNQARAAARRRERKANV